MVQRRRHPRITATGDLTATVRRADQPADFDALVLDLSERGALIAGGGLAVGESVGIEFTGPTFRLAGQAEVVHCTGHTTGLHIVSWSGPADRVICALIAARLAVRPGARVRRPLACAQQAQDLRGVRGTDDLRAGRRGDAQGAESGLARPAAGVSRRATG